MRKLLLALLCWCSVAAVVRADFEAGNRLYDEGKFAEAKAAYEESIITGERGANLFYNLGNTNQRLGAIGEAQLEYLRALTLAPSHPEARANLNLLRGQSGAVTWPSSWLDELFPAKWADGVAIAGAVAGWVALFALAAIFLIRKPDKTGLWTAAVLAVLVAAYAGAALWHFEQSRGLAVITAKTAEVHFAPAETSAQGVPLPAGSEVRVLSRRGDWVYCALPSQGRGWIAARAVARVRLEDT